MLFISEGNSVSVSPASSETHTTNSPKLTSTLTSEIIMTPEGLLNKPPGQKSPLLNGSIPSHHSKSDSCTKLSNDNEQHKNPSTSNQNYVPAANQNGPTNQKNSSFANQNGLSNGNLGSSPIHQRNLSNASSTNSSAILASPGVLEVPYGLIVGLHRKMVRKF